MRWLRAADTAAGAPERVRVYRTYGRGEERIAALQPGETRYLNGLAELARARIIAAAYGRDLVVRALCLDIGVNDRTDGTSHATFTARLVALINGVIGAMGAGNAAGSDPVKVIIAQTNAHSVLAEAGIPAQVQYELARSRADVALVAKYDLPMSDNNHLTSLGYALKGERLAIARRRRIEGSAAHASTFPTAFARAGAQINITFHTPAAPLVFDTTTLPAAFDNGFVVFAEDGTTVLDIASVVITTSTTLRITLAADPGGPVVVTYAMHGAGASGRARAWGNLRDSSAAASIADPSFTLRDWCPSFQETVS